MLDLRAEDGMSVVTAVSTGLGIFSFFSFLVVVSAVMVWSLLLVLYLGQLKKKLDKEKKKREAKEKRKKLEEEQRVVEELTMKRKKEKLKERLRQGRILEKQMAAAMAGKFLNIFYIFLNILNSFFFVVTDSSFHLLATNHF